MLLNASVSIRQATSADWPAVEALLLANKLPPDGARDHPSVWRGSTARSGRRHAMLRLRISADGQEQAMVCVRFSVG